MASSGGGRLSRLPLTGRVALLPALGVVAVLVAVALGYAVAQSLGAFPLDGRRDLGFAAYRDVLAGDGVAGDVWASVGFTVWVSVASTILAATIALAFIAWLERPRRGRRLATSLLHVNLAIPHVVWAVALVLVMSQSGVVARFAALIGLVDEPADFPALVGDRFGVGIILHVATKEAPFLVLVGLALLRAQPRALTMVADTFGVRGFRRVRWVIAPVVAPGLVVAGAVIFAFVVGAYEAPAVLGASAPRMLSVLGLDLFSTPDLARRPAAMALGVMMTAFVAVTVWLVAVVSARRSV